MTKYFDPDLLIRLTRSLIMTQPLSPCWASKVCDALKSHFACILCPNAYPVYIPLAEATDQKALVWHSSLWFRLKSLLTMNTERMLKRRAFLYFSLKAEMALSSLVFEDLPSYRFLHYNNISNGLEQGYHSPRHSPSEGKGVNRQRRAMA